MTGPVVEVVTRSDAETRGLGRRLANQLRPGDVLLLSGGLGAGKTAFAAGLAEGLGVEEPVTSPTFVLVRRYDSGFIPLVHVDVYRLGSLGEVEDLDLFEQAADAVLVIEWGGAVESVMPDDHLVVAIEIVGTEERRIRLHPKGAWRDRPLTEVAG